MNIVTFFGAQVLLGIGALVCLILIPVSADAYRYVAAKVAGSIAGVVACITVMCLLGSASALNTSPGTGEKVGSVVKLSEVGIRCLTWEGQLIRGGLADGTGVAGTVPFDFTVADTSLLAPIRDAMEHNREVLLTYRSTLFSWCASESANHFVVGVRVLR